VVPAESAGDSHLFAVRVWLEEVDGGRFEWRGHVEHVMSGRRRYFRSWSGLAEKVKAFLTQPYGSAWEDEAQR
jgi:hypothetical protein